MARSVAEQYRGWCIHFNGIAKERCKLGIAYDSVRDSALPGLPCIQSDGRPLLQTCDKQRFPTQEEAEAHEREVIERLRQRTAALAAGECPDHKRKVEFRQAGSCVYGSCGCRLYQGRLPKAAR